MRLAWERDLSCMHVVALLLPVWLFMYMLSLFVQVQDFTDKVNFYVMNAVTFFKSMWPEVKCNAALFVGKSPDVTALQSLVPRSHISLHGDVTRTDLIVNTHQFFMPLCCYFCRLYARQFTSAKIWYSFKGACLWRWVFIAEVATIALCHLLGDL